MNDLQKTTPMMLKSAPAFLPLLLFFLSWMTSLSGQAFRPANGEQTAITRKSGENFALDGADGPYLFVNGSQLREVVVRQRSDNFIIEQKTLRLEPQLTFTCLVDNPDRDQFSFSLQPRVITPPVSYPMPQKLFAVSDMEGNFDAFYSLLTANKVMDGKMNWIYGNGHLVLVGDFMDRGRNVTQVLWLIYKLEQEARQAGGMVHFILGNHEAMNLQGHTTYTNKKYLALAQQLTGIADYSQAYRSLLGENSVLGKWLESKNVMERIGNMLFVHGGVSPELVKSGLSLEAINTIARSHIREERTGSPADDEYASLIVGRLGPLWYRGLVMNYKDYYQKASAADVDAALRHFGVSHIMVGHSIVDKISADYGGKVYRLDIKQPETKYSGGAQALLVTGNNFYIATDKR